jgi:phosphate acetyltransferase
MNDERRIEKYAKRLAAVRAHKGVTEQMAREKLTDPSYFATMMVHMGDADGMVSGATHTTANTIRPAFEIIKTKPGIKVVSGSYFMCMADQVLMFADCAVNPNPNADELADIAIGSADTAAAFGIEPRVAMLSYSTGTSGIGPDVDLVCEATRIVRERRPDIVVDGPLQFDAAIDPEVGEFKMPGSPVAGRATVFVFPDLQSGNSCYKAVQRTAGAVAVGPILQGLRQTVTDLSRGAMVDDIVSTIAITAVQAQE